MKLTITIDRTAMLLIADTQDGSADRETYNLSTDMAVAANLRKALDVCALLRNPRRYDRVTVVVDTPTILIPTDEFSAGSAATLYGSTLVQHQSDEVQTFAIEALEVVAAFAVSKDLRFVLEENFRYVCFEPRLAATLMALSRVSYGGFQEKMFCVFRGSQFDIIAFRKHRLRFCNSFQADVTEDAVYFILGVWQQLAMRQTDILVISGTPSEPETLKTKLEQFVKNVSFASI